MTISITTQDGYVLTAHTGGAYMDYGLEICHPHASDELYYSPHALCGESYGATEDGEAWTDEEWAQCLLNESNDFLEAFVGHDALAALDPTEANGDPRGDDNPAGWCVDCAAPAGDCPDWEA